MQSEFPSRSHPTFRNCRYSVQWEWSMLAATGWNWLLLHGENDFVTSTKRFDNTASANQNCCGDDFTCYDDNCNCCDNSLYRCK